MNNRFGLPSFSTRNTAHLLTVCVIAVSIIQGIMMQSKFHATHSSPCAISASCSGDTGGKKQKKNSNTTGAESLKPPRSTRSSTTLETT